MSKLGILVVYVFDETLQPLFDIHLDRIRRRTKADYKIYAAGQKLSREHFDHVDQNPDIELLRLDVPKEFGVRDEHSFCLRRLADKAFADGCDHVICMHLDSFPIADGWEDAFIGPIEKNDAAVVSIVPNGYSAGLCWGREFENTYRPAMLVSAEERDSEDFARFIAEFPDFDHVETGLGIIFAAYRSGLGWARIGTDSERKIYGGLLFHVVGATWRTWFDIAPIRTTPFARVTWPLARQIVRALPKKLGRPLQGLYIDYDRVSRDGSFNSKLAENIALMTDPDGYVAAQLESYRASEKIYG